MNEIKKQAFFGMLWGSGNYVFQQVILLAVKLILVRLLIPEEFGIVAMAWIVISSLNILNTFGVGMAFVRDNRSDLKKAKNTLFWLKAPILFLIAVIGFFSAPYVAQFFGDRISDPAILVSLEWMVKLLALVQLSHITTIVPTQMLTRELKFKQKIVSGALGTVAYGVVAPILAFMGYGAWSIIIAQLANILVQKVVLFWFSPFIPSLTFDRKIAKSYIRFGSNSFINSIMKIIMTNGDDTLIGKILGTAALGFYSLGQHFAGLIVSVISGMMTGVMFPVLSRMQDDKKVFSRAFFKAFRINSILTIPAIAGAVILAPEIITVVFGERWLPIVPIFYILSIAAFMNNFINLAGPVLNSLNRPEVLRNNKLIQFGFYVILVYPFIKLWGILGICWVMVIFSIVSIIYITPKLTQAIPNYYTSVMKIVAKVVAATAIMVSILHFIKPFFSVNLLSLITLVIIGSVFYFISIWIFDKENLRWDLQEALGMIKERLGLK